MEDLTHIEQEINNLIGEIKAHPQDTEDMRRSYLELVLNALHSYYIQWLTLQAAEIMRHKKLAPTQSATPEEIKVLYKFLNSTVNDGYHMRIRASYRSLFLDSWSTFEFCITYLCASLFSEEIQKNLLEDDFNKVDKILSGYEVTADDKRKVLKAYTKKHLTHLSINRKYEKIYSMFKNNYVGNWISDKTFLEFFGKYRNCMHTNYIYHGTDVEYTILGIRYKFSDGDPISQTEVATVNNMFDIALELKNVCRRLFDAIQHPGLLPFPSDKVVAP